ncbi:DUF6177 family protein [Streptomyces yerevanensis]|uniref:DUF6177 family protein n=1 Tax=Streptomyces yerevanensis TaxID=66378 RepID=UPI000524084F|nr:DUF6177 family protein [Streptomyces yerevanensis]
MVQQGTRNEICMADYAPRPTDRPALHYALGDGTTSEAWTTLQQLTAHLKAAPRTEHQVGLHRP